jgi:ribonuclease HI
MCFSNNIWPWRHLAANIYNSIKVIKSNFSTPVIVAPADRLVKWNNNNHTCVILNVDGSCHGSPIRSGFRGILRNNDGFFLSGFSGFIPGSDDIMLAELSANYHGLITTQNLGFVELVCYSDSLVCINLINGSLEKYHIHVVLIQDIKELLHQSNVTVCHTLREGNQCADFLAKLGASSDVDLLIHDSPPDGLLNLI